MFERLWAKGSHVRGRNLLRAALLATMTASVWNGVEVNAWGQLRTGRTDRSLYRDQITAPQAASPATNSARSRMQPRSRVVRAGAEYSIMEQGQTAAPDQPGRVSPQASAPSAGIIRPAPPDAAQPGPEPLPVDDNMMTFDEGSESYPVQEGHGNGCSCGRCGGDRYFADLAPGCYDGNCGVGVCDGPIARLLSNLSVRAEAPLFWRRGMALPPLVTTSPTGTASNVAGQIGRSTTQVLLGNDVVGQDLRAGLRISLGTWLDSNQYRGLLVRYTNAGNLSTDFNFDSSTTPILARPFTNISTGTATADTQLISFPGDTTGNIRVHTDSQVDAFDIVIRRLAYRDRFTRVDWLYGYQHNHIAESLRIDSNTSVTGNVPPLTGTSIAVTDLIRTTNNFSGGVLGLMSSRQFACWKFEALARMGLGDMSRRVDIRGATTTTSAAGVPTTDTQGLLARSTNSHPLKDDTFTVVPEFGLNAGYYLTPNIDFLVGYNYLLLPNVAQPGKQIDTTVNLSDPLAGATRPQLALSTKSYWLHSLNLGVQWRY